VIDPARQHVIADVVACTDLLLLDDVGELSELLVEACTMAGAHVLGTLTHHFDPQGATVLVLLAESHASIHTWPEHALAFVDAFTCGAVDPAAIVEVVVDALGGTAQLVRLA